MSRLTSSTAHFYEMPQSSSPLGQAALITALKGQTLRIPSLQALFRSWPSPRLNSHYAALVPLASAAILDIAKAAPHLHIERRLRDDIALLTCLLFPTAPRQRIEALVLYMVWLVCWDDTVDTTEGDLAADFAGAEQWRNRTLEIVRTALRLSAEEPGEVDAINAVFVGFGQRYCGDTHEIAPDEQRQRLYDEIYIFIRACATEQRLRLDGIVPSFEDYMALREGTVAGGTLCALVPHAMSSQPVPPALLAMPQLAVFRKQANVLFGLLNDLISLKKELAMDCVVNAVCTLLRPETPLEEVMARIYRTLRDAVRLFDEAAGELLDQVGDRGPFYDLAVELIDGHRSVVTGTLEFMLKSPRYNISQLLREDGSLEIVL